MTLALTTALVLGGAAAAAVAGTAIAADAALLSGEGDEPPSSASAQRHAREHHALAAVRAAALLLAGIALGVGLRHGGWPLLTTLLAGAAALLLVAILTEGIGRSVGESRALAVRARTRGLRRIATSLLAPVVEAGAGLDATLVRMFSRAAADDEQEERAVAGFQRFVLRIPDAVPGQRRTSRLTPVVNSIFTLSETHVEAVMVPRVDVVAIDRDTPWADVVARLRSAGFARYPVFDGTVDDVIGILYAKDLMPAIVADEQPADGWHELLRPASFIPATRTLETQLREFQLGRTHIAIVVDEYGGTAGIVTIEDILEEIFGDIRDEYDEEEPAIEHEEGERYWVASRVSLEELGEALGHDFATEDVQTVGGLIYAHLGRVPLPGEAFVLDGFRVVVEQVRRRRIRRVYFERVSTAPDRESA